MPEDFKFEDTLFYHWMENLVGSNTTFSINLSITLTIGFLYSLKVLTSPFVLLIFGVISPIIFTLCLYSFIRNGKGELFGESFPKAFLSRASNKFLMAFDISLIIGFALLIYYDYTNYFFFRFLQTIFFPGMLLVFLRTLFINSNTQNFNDEAD